MLCIHESVVKQQLIKPYPAARSLINLTTEMITHLII